MRKSSRAMRYPARSLMVLLGSLLLALITNLLPIPEWAQNFRPDVLLLVIMFWCLKRPDRISVGSALILGVLSDVALGDLLGLHAMVYVCAVYAVHQFYYQLRVFTRLQQAMWVALIYLLQLILLTLIQRVHGHTPINYGYFLSVFSSLLFWPWFSWFMADWTVPDDRIPN